MRADAVRPTEIRALPLCPRGLGVSSVVIALHALWSAEGDLCIWGERSSLPARGRRPPGRPPVTPVPRQHPFACEGALLADALGALGAPSDVSPPSIGSPGALVLRLPSWELGPQASPHLLRVVDDGGSTEAPKLLLPWEVEAIRLPAVAAVGLLLALPASPPAGVAIGDSLRYLAEAVKLALELVARGRLRPVLERDGERWVARWRPVTDAAEDAARVELLVRAMPPLLRAELSPLGRAESVPTCSSTEFSLSSSTPASASFWRVSSPPQPSRMPVVGGLFAAWLSALVGRRSGGRRRRVGARRAGRAAGAVVGGRADVRGATHVPDLFPARRTCRGRGRGRHRR